MHSMQKHLWIINTPHWYSLAYLIDVHKPIFICTEMRWEWGKRSLICKAKFSSLSLSFYKRGNYNRSNPVHIKRLTEDLFSFVSVFSLRVLNQCDPSLKKRYNSEANNSHCNQSQTGEYLSCESRVSRWRNLYQPLNWNRNVVSKYQKMAVIFMKIQQINLDIGMLQLPKVHW